MINTKTLLFLLGSAVILAGCSHKVEQPTKAKVARPSPAEIFNLRTKCQELSDKMLAEYAIGAHGPALRTVSESTHYNPETNHCYYESQLGKNFSFTGGPKGFVPVADDYLTVQLVDVQTRDQLLYVTQQNGKRSAYDWMPGGAGSGADYKTVLDKIQELMTGE
jgi:hypothetical protein